MKKDMAVKGSLWQATVYAAFQRAKVYATNVSEEKKRSLREGLKKEIDAFLPKYAFSVSESDHVKNIETISTKINSQFSSSLEHGAIPIGVVQKSFNLYLKLLWCLGEIHEPPHCPLDKVIIDKIPYKHRKSWTKIRDIKTYKDLIAHVSKIAQAANQSLAAWELENYEKP